MDFAAGQNDLLNGMELYRFALGALTAVIAGRERLICANSFWSDDPYEGVDGR
jgi:hypothetical protein